MPFSIDIDTGHNLVILTGRGEVYLADFVKTFDAFVAHPDFRPGMNVLWDLTKTVTSILPEDVQTFAAHTSKQVGQRGSGYKIAVVGNERIILGFTQIYKRLAPALAANARTFMNLDEALAWIREDA